MKRRDVSRSGKPGLMSGIYVGSVYLVNYVEGGERLDVAAVCCSRKSGVKVALRGGFSPDNYGSVWNVEKRQVQR